MNKFSLIFILVVFVFVSCEKKEEGKELASAENSSVFTSRNEFKNIQDRAKAVMEKNVAEITGETEEEVEIFQAAFSEEGFENIKIAYLTAGIRHFYYPLDFDLLEFLTPEVYISASELSDEQASVLSLASEYLTAIQKGKALTSGILKGRENILKSKSENLASLGDDFIGIRLGLPEQDRNRMIVPFKLLEEDRWSSGILYYLFENDVWLLESMDISLYISEEKKEEGLFNPSSLL